MDYLLLHGDFNKVKAESVNRFQAHEQVNMQNHVNQRAVTLLKSAAALEKTNERNLLNKVVSSAIEQVDKKLLEDADLIDEAMFESAQIGIAKNEMTYEGDPILPLAQQTVKEKVAEFKNLTDEKYCIKMICIIY